MTNNLNCDALLGDDISYCPCGCYECSLGDAESCCSPREECSLHMDDPILQAPLIFGIVGV